VSDTNSVPASRNWRSVWRLHFYAGLFSMPFILLMSVTGLVILYTDPIQELRQNNLRRVEVGSSPVSFDAQAAAVQAKYPKATMRSMAVPKDASTSTRFAIDDGTDAGREVFVDPYTGKVLGDRKPGSDLVGFSNRLHGFLNNNSFKVSLPSTAALLDGGKIMRPYIVGDLVLEILGVWTLVLVMSGLFLWWPRKRASEARVAKGGATRRRVGLRRGVTGRARWRDLHGMSGVLLFGVMVMTLVSGMAWSTYWGPNFTALANKISPNAWTEAPPSPLGSRGDLDRLGNQIPWNTGDSPLAVSPTLPANGTVPQPLSLDKVAAIGADEGMKPGYTINFPTNEPSEKGDVVFGSYLLSNSWPRKTGEARDLYLNQFSGETLANTSAFGYGAVSRSLDTLVSTHMGTQLGIVSRVLMTALCVLAIWSVCSAMVMFLRRRRPGTAGLPRRPADVKLSRRLSISTVLLGVIFPVWGICAAVVLAIDRFVIRGVGPLRVAFGQR
jgi:uncharacterized iron-regulated membrane protein